MTDSARIAIVTGASRVGGIGAAIAQALAADGWSLLLTGYPSYDRTQGSTAPADGLTAVADTVRDSTGGRVETLEADLAEADGAQRVLAACLERFGPPSALVNNSAASERGGIERVDAAQLDRHWQVNARAPMLLTKAFAEHFAGGTGSVVNLTSGQSLGPMPDELAYAASKGALEAFTVSAAAALAPRGIRVNAIDPGPTDTGWMSDTDLEQLRAPLGRVGQPADAARLVAFLCSDRAGWITGQILRSRGGF